MKTIFKVMIGLFGVLALIGFLTGAPDKPSAANAEAKDAANSPKPQPKNKIQWYQVRETCVLAVGDQSIQETMKFNRGCIKRHPQANPALTVVDCSKEGLGQYIFAPSLAQCKETLEFMQRQRAESP